MEMTKKSMQKAMAKCVVYVKPVLQYGFVPFVIWVGLQQEPKAG